MSVGPLLTVFGFLSCRAATVSTSDILFLLGLGFHLAVVFRLISSTSEVDAVFKNVLKIVHNPSNSSSFGLMVEQTYTSKRHCDTILIASLNNIVVANRTTSLGDELYATLMSALDIVAKGEESV